MILAEIDHLFLPKMNMPPWECRSTMAGARSVAALRDVQIGGNAELGRCRKDDLLADEVAQIAPVHNFGVRLHLGRPIAEAMQNEFAPLGAILVDAPPAIAEKRIRIVAHTREPVELWKQRSRIGSCGSVVFARLIGRCAGRLLPGTGQRGGSRRQARRHAAPVDWFGHR